jgi:hypothetical protein
MIMRETAWLIESRYTPGPMWWTGGTNPAPWTRDSLQAVRFCRKQDAVAALVTLPDGHMCFASEHTWGLAEPDAEAQPSDARAEIEQLKSDLSEAQAGSTRGVRLPSRTPSGTGSAWRKSWRACGRASLTWRGSETMRSPSTTTLSPTVHLRPGQHTSGSRCF